MVIIVFANRRRIPPVGSRWLFLFLRFGASRQFPLSRFHFPSIFIFERLLVNGILTFSSLHPLSAYGYYFYAPHRARVLYFVLSYLISTSLVMGNAVEFKTVSAKRFPRLFTVSSIIQCPPAGLTTLSPLTLCHRNARLEECSLLESKISSRLFQNEAM